MAAAQGLCHKALLDDLTAAHGGRKTPQERKENTSPLRTGEQ